MRSTVELIAELDQETSEHSVVALVVGFENSSIMIFTKQADRLQVLNDAIEQGGHPLGLVASDLKDGVVTFLHRVYPEHSGEDAELAESVLSRLGAFVASQLQGRGAA